jgi:integrase
VHLTPKTVASYRSLLRTRILPRWGSVPLSAVAYSEVSVWVSQMVADGLSASRVRQAYHLLHAMLDDAVKGSRLVRNPAAGVDLPRLSSSQRRYLTHHQVTELANGCGEYRTLVLLLAYSGLRWGEVAALRVGSVDLMRGRLRVVEAVSDVSGRMVFGEPKSHQSRTVPVPRFLRDDLALQVAGKAPGELVFTSPEGAVLRVNNFRRRTYDAAAVLADLPGLTVHELRHTAASLAIASGASVKAVQAMLGHASATLTLDRYGHLFPDELDSLAERMDAARGNAGAPPVRPGSAPTPITRRVHSL